ncbi:Phage protein [Salmonella phage Tennessee]
MADNLKVKINKQKKRVEIEIGEERVAFTFEFLQQMAMTVMTDRSPVIEKDIPLK